MTSLSEHIGRWSKGPRTGPRPLVKALEMAGLIEPECACKRGPVTTFHGCVACHGEAVAAFLEGLK